MTRKLLILAPFRVDIGPGQTIYFQPGVVLEDSEMPEGQSADDWIAKGLAQAAQAASSDTAAHAAGAGDPPAREAGAAV